MLTSNILWMHTVDGHHLRFLRVYQAALITSLSSIKYRKKETFRK